MRPFLRLGIIILGLPVSLIGFLSYWLWSFMEIGWNMGSKSLDWFDK